MLYEGDLVKVSTECIGKEVYVNGNCTVTKCCCFFCINDSAPETAGIGLVTSAWIDEDDEQAVIVEFPIGEWVFRGKERSELILLSSE